jgi:hypothetical protein
LESYQSLDVENGFTQAIWTFTSQVMVKRTVDLKVKNRPDPDACKGSATHRWKALDKSYKFALDLIPIGGLSKEL